MTISPLNVYRFVITKGIMFSHQEEYNITITEVKMPFKFLNRNITKKNHQGAMLHKLSKFFLVCEHILRFRKMC